MIRHNGRLLEIMQGDCIGILDSMRLTGFKIQSCITSPPYYGLRDYGHSSQIGLEETPEQYILKLLNVFSLVRNIMADDGTLWINIGDSYAGSGKGRSKNGTASSVDDFQGSNKGSRKGILKKTEIKNCKSKDLIGIPWMLAFALRNDGWYLRQDIIWAKPNPMPESVRDRCTRAHEYLFLLSKSKNYYFNAPAIAELRTSKEDAKNFRGGAYINNSTFKNSEGGKRSIKGNKIVDSITCNKRSVWTIAPRGFKGAHFATFPPELITPCILAGSRPKDLILDPFGGSGTTGGVALKHNRNALIFELNPDYIKLIPERVNSILNLRKF